MAVDIGKLSVGVSVNTGNVGAAFQNMTRDAGAWAAATAKSAASAQGAIDRVKANPASIVPKALAPLKTLPGAPKSRVDTGGADPASKAISITAQQLAAENARAAFAERMTGVAAVKGVA